MTLRPFFYVFFEIRYFIRLLQPQPFCCQPSLLTTIQVINPSLLPLKEDNTILLALKFSKNLIGEMIPSRYNFMDSSNSRRAINYNLKNIP